MKRSGRAYHLAIRALSVLALVFTWGAPARGDDWAGPEVKEVFSASRDHFVRVIPGKSLGDTVGFGGSPKGPYAKAEFYARQADHSYNLGQTPTLLNPVAPVQFFVSNDGHLATIDNWHNVGHGVVVAVYNVQGDLLKAYRLADLFSPTEIKAFPLSVSSRHWHQGPVYINRDQRTLYMMVESGRDLVIGLETGRFALCETRDGKYLCRDSNSQRRWLPYTEVALER
jgi:hypothetical protein